MKTNAESALQELESPGDEWCSPDQRRCIGGIIRARMAELEAQANAERNYITVTVDMAMLREVFVNAYRSSPVLCPIEREVWRKIFGQVTGKHEHEG